MNEIVALSKAERDRLVVLRQVKEGKLKQATAAKQLKLSTRWVKKLLQLSLFDFLRSTTGEGRGEETHHDLLFPQIIGERNRPSR